MPSKTTVLGPRGSNLLAEILRHLLSTALSLKGELFVGRDVFRRLNERFGDMVDAETAIETLIDLGYAVWRRGEAHGAKWERLYLHTPQDAMNLPLAA